MITTIKEIERFDIPIMDEVDKLREEYFEEFEKYSNKN